MLLMQKRGIGYPSGLNLYIYCKIYVKEKRATIKQEDHYGIRISNQLTSRVYKLFVSLPLLGWLVDRFGCHRRFQGQGAPFFTPTEMSRQVSFQD